MKTLNLKSKDIVSAMRFDGSYHISEGTIFLKKLKRMPHADLISFCPNIFTAGRNKRVYTDKEKGFPYLSNSDVVKNNPFESCNYNSKKYGFDKTAFLKEGMILTGRVGAIGQTSYVTKEFEENQAMGSDNIIRIVAKDKKMSGYIYAFLVSKYGNALFNRLAAGGVQPYISEAMLQDIPIPILPEETQQKIHSLIVESAQLRVEANKMLKEAVEIFENEIGESKANHSFQFGKISSDKLYDFHKRFDSQYQLGWDTLQNEKKRNFTYLKISKIASNIFVGGRGKRNYIENGVPFLSSSDMMLFNPKRNCKKISGSTQGIKSMKVGLNDILISRSGTVGNTVIVGKDLERTAISEHALRLVIDEKMISPFYVFTFLKTNYGLKTMESSSFGSVIITLNEDLIGNIEIPILNEDLQNKIIDLTKKYIANYDLATNLENQAIDLIEKEIDQWQQ